jgi:hypothetical protein
MRIKHAFAALRSIDYSPNVQPMLLTPGHGSFPSGHSTQAYTIARVLANVCAPRNGGRSIIKREYDKLLEVLERQAARVAVNRTVAGVHFPIDSACGRLLGTTLADYLIARSSPAAQFTPGRFKSGEFDENEDFDPTADPYTNGAVRINRPHKLQGSRLFAWLFDQARREWDGTALNTSGPRGRWPAR